MALNKKTERLLRPNFGLYFILLLIFVIAAIVLRQYALAGIELAVWALFMAAYIIHQANRRKQLKAFVEKCISEQVGVGDGI